MAASSEAKATAPKANATAKSFLILPSPATRKFSPTLPTAGQIVVLTNPEIGNYGTNSDDNEATQPYIEGLIVREFSKVSSNWRSQQVAEEYLEQFKVPVLADIDTRALVRHLRDNGVMRGVISTLESDTDKAGRQGALHPQDGRHRPGEGSHHQRSLRLGGGRALARADGSGRRERRAAAHSTSSPTTTASSTTFCASCAAKAARSRWCRRRLRPKMCWR